MPAFITDPELAPAMLRCLNETAMVLPEERGNLLKEYALGYLPWTIAVNGAMFQCLDAAMQDHHLRVRAFGLLRHHHAKSYEHIFAPVVLAWAQTQPWASKMNLDGALMSWIRESSFRNRKATSCGFVSLFLMQVVTLKEAFPNTWLDKVFAETIQLGKAWDSRSVDAQELCALLLGVGEAIQTCIKDGAARYKRHYEWIQWVAHSLSPLDADTQFRMSKAILASSVLSNECKLDVHRNSSPMVWIRNFQHINALLPSCEIHRLQMAPWCAMPKSKIANGTLAAINRALTEVTSPTLYSMLNVLACENDWCDWDRMSILLDPLKQNATQLALPENLEENYHDENQP